MPENTALRDSPSWSKIPETAWKQLQNMNLSAIIMNIGFIPFWAFDGIQNICVFNRR